MVASPPEGGSRDRSVCMSQRSGDVFVVLSGDGLFWDGRGWTGDWDAAVKFIPGVLCDPWLECHRLCVELRFQGWRAVPAYVAGSEVRFFKRPYRQPPHVAASGSDVPGLIAAV